MPMTREELEESVQKDSDCLSSNTNPKTCPSSPLCQTILRSFSTPSGIGMLTLLGSSHAIRIFILSFFAFSKLAVAADEIKSLPGWKGKLPSRMWSGYLTAGSSRLFYWFVASESSALSSPLVTWFNGGPGCSSLGGFLTENGPFETDGTNLILREFRWSQFANMLWFENPVGVGFSYSTTHDYNVGDEASAADNLLALKSFFVKFPEMASRDLYFAGESYAGIYIPMLAQRVLQAQDAKTWTGGVLKGIAVGNGCSGNGIGACSNACESIKYHTEFIMGLSYIDASLKRRLGSSCNWNACNKQGINESANAISNECFDLINQANNLLSAVNVYNVYDTCTINDGCGNNNSAWETNQVTPVHAVGLLKKEAEARGIFYDSGDTMTLRASAERELRIGNNGDLGLDDDNGPEWASISNAYGSGPQGCIDSTTATQYLMTPAVQKAIHAKLPENACWSFCSHIGGDKWVYDRTMMDEPKYVYPSLFGRINVLIYNGDVDDCVPYTDNVGWVSNLGFGIKKSWGPWFYHSYSVLDAQYSSQLGGYMVEYDPPKPPVGKKSNLGSKSATFHFATVRGSGHVSQMINWVKNCD